MSAANGALFPVSMLFFADIVNAFIIPIDMQNKVDEKAIIFSIVGAIGLVLGFFQAYLLVMVADHQVRRIRMLYYKVSRRLLVEQNIDLFSWTLIPLFVSQIRASCGKIYPGTRTTRWGV